MRGPGRGTGFEEQVVFLQEPLEMEQQQPIEPPDARHALHRHDGIVVHGVGSATGGRCR